MLKNTAFLSLLVFSVICGVSTWVGLKLTGHPFDPRFLLLLVYFTLVTGLLLFWQEKSAARTNIFIRRFMAGLVFKLMGSLVLLAILIKTAPKELTGPLAVVFSILYLAYLGFGVARLSAVVRRTNTAQS